MASAWAVYDLLLDQLASGGTVEEVLIGLTWTLCRADGRTGLAMSPGIPSRTLPWAGTLAGRDARELAGWLRAWQPHEAAVGMAAVNALLDSTLAASARPLYPEGPANLAVLDYFRPQLEGKRVVVVGRYPGLERFEKELDSRFKRLWDASHLSR